MKSQTKENSINSDALAYIKSLIHPQVEIVDLEVRGKWLRASLSSGVYFSIINSYGKEKK